MSSAESRMREGVQPTDIQHTGDDVGNVKSAALLRMLSSAFGTLLEYGVLTRRRDLYLVPSRSEPSQ